MLRIGECFDTYYVIDEIASGGMASVSLAYDCAHHRFVALKTLFTQLAADEMFVKRLRREGDIYRGLRHPNIITLLDARFEGFPYLALEYIHGRTLSDLISMHEEGLPLARSVSVLEDITNALFQAHANGIIHRDLQPQNVLVDQSGVVKLFDFGIAYADDNLLQTMTGTIMGTILYSSPEQNQGKPVDERSDLYSLGMVFYEMHTGRPAVTGRNLNEVLSAKLESEIPSPEEIRPGMPADLVSMTMKLLEKVPEKRFRSIRHLLDYLIDLKVAASAELRSGIFGNEEEALLSRAKRALAVDRFDEALDAAQTYAERCPVDSDFLHLLARIHRGKGDDARARQSYEKALEMAGFRAEYLIDYATYLHGRGDAAAAHAMARRVLDEIPHHPCARGLCEALEKLGEVTPSRRPTAETEQTGESEAIQKAEASADEAVRGAGKAVRGIKKVLGDWLQGKK